MTNIDLSVSYMKKARARLGMLQHLLDAEDYSDVVREAQETVELATKAMLRRIGIDPPKWHDVSSILKENSMRFPASVASRIDEIAGISKALRRERELSFYGDIDFIPSEEYSREHAEKAMADARFVITIASQMIEE